MPKNHIRLESYGTVDELNSHIGLVAALATVTNVDGDQEPVLPAEDRQLLHWIQNKLFDLGSELATEPESAYKPRQIAVDDIAVLERAIDRVDATLPVHNRFILPGGTTASAEAQVARTVARRAERYMLTLAQSSEAQPAVSDNAMRFINRLSDYLFVLARQLNALTDTPEHFWDQNL